MHILKLLDRSKYLFALTIFLFMININVVNSEEYKNEIVQVFAGGVAGSKDLSIEKNSDKFRLAGGNLYLHNSGWKSLNNDTKKKILKIWKDSGIGIELGYGTKKKAQAWGNTYKKYYHKYGIRPMFIAVNAFAKRNNPSPREWIHYSQILRKNGVPEETKILPTFEYQNVRANRANLHFNKVSKIKSFQKIIQYAEGIVIDSPPGYFFDREKSYRDWIIDAIHWTKKRGYLCVVLVSPHKSGKSFDEDTKKFLQYLEEKNAVPDILVSENYKIKTKKNYPNVVGNEDIPETTLGVGVLMLKNWLPSFDLNR